MAGPTKDRNFDGLIVTLETKKSIDIINNVNFNIAYFKDFVNK